MDKLINKVKKDEMKAGSAIKKGMKDTKVLMKEDKKEDKNKMMMNKMMKKGDSKMMMKKK